MEQITSPQNGQPSQPEPKRAKWTPKFTQTPWSVYEDHRAGRITSLDAIVYGLISGHCLRLDECFVEQKTFAELAGRSIKAIHLSLKRLEAVGHIRRTSRGKNKSHLIRLLTKVKLPQAANTAPASSLAVSKQITPDMLTPDGIRAAVKARKDKEKGELQHHHPEMSKTSNTDDVEEENDHSDP